MTMASRQSRFITTSLVFLLYVCGTHRTPAAGTNSWNSAVTGAWESLSWSLSVRPDISQSAILITNYGQKAVILGANARDNFPASLSISNLLIAGTPLSTNTLFLNFTGTTTPLRIFNSCTVQNNGVLLNQSSAIHVIGGSNAATYVDGGTINQVGGSNRFEGTIHIGSVNPGLYNATNGIVVADQLIIGGNIGGTFNQVGGSVTAQTYLWIGSTTNKGLYTLSGGDLIANKADIGVGINSAGEFVQNSGTFTVSQLSLSAPFGADARYTLKGGVLSTGGLSMGILGQSDFVQNGGILNSGHVSVGSSYPGSASYTLSGGLLTCTGMGVTTADFGHSAGTNRVAGQLFISEGTYNLSGGELDSESVSLSASRVSPGFFVQTGGKYVVTNSLEISGESMGGAGPGYFLAGGTLDCGQIDIGFNGRLQHTGGSLTAHGPVTIERYGTLYASNVSEQLGPLLLSNDGPCFDTVIGTTQHFAFSANTHWDTNAFLVISGDGPVYFGNSASALTARQLLQITFYAGGDYVRLLSDGQLVPYPVPPIDQQINGNNLTLSWTGPPGIGVSNGGITLQAADNVTGPYVDVPAATSPYVVPFNSKSKFFRLTRQ